MVNIVSRQDAQAKGLKRFYTGEPCRRNHLCERFTCNGGCVRCMQFLTPNRKNGAKGTNVGWPVTGLVFQTPNVLQEEMEAAYRYVEAMGWHDYAVAEMRKDPTLLEKYITRLKPSEIGVLEATLERARRKGGGMQNALFTLACGFGQMYYGPRKRLGETVLCNHCDTEQAITKVE